MFFVLDYSVLFYIIISCIFLYFNHIFYMVIYMKIFLISKEELSIFYFAILLFGCVFLNQYHKADNPLAVDIACNSEISAEFVAKFQNLPNETEKVAYLTFDDGPTASVTPKILDILNEENIKATFFVIGKSVEANPEIVKRAYEEGHYIANHGYNHNNSDLYKSSQSFIEQVKNTDAAISKAINVDNYCSHIFRFPNGFMTPIYKKQKEEAVSLLLDMNYTYIDWNCLTKDSEKKYTKTELLNNLKKSSKDKNTLIVLMHDTKDINDSSLILKDVIYYLKSQGYEFKNFYSLL